jgi:hypothetical protein
MAFVEHLASSTSYRLSAHCLIGRAPTCAVRLTSDLTSNLHAEIRWTGSDWELRDLGSLNGTFIDDQPLETGGRRPITAGTQIAFGDLQDRFKLIDDSPPVAVATGPDGRAVVATNGFLLLPDDERPLYQVFQDASHRWIAESTDGQQQPLVDGGTLQIGSETWCLELPVVTKSTAPLGMALESLTLRLWTSRHGEHIEVELCQGSSSKRLESRAHDALLLRLAEIRLEDQKIRELSEREQGWVHVDALIKELDVNRNWIDVSVFRVRQQLAEANVRGAAGFIERRRDSGEIRLAVRRMEIVKL